MDLDVWFVTADGTQETHHYHADRFTTQLWPSGRGSIELHDNGQRTGGAIYRDVTLIRWGSATSANSSERS